MNNPAFELIRRHKDVSPETEALVLKQIRNKCSTTELITIFENGISGKYGKLYSADTQTLVGWVDRFVKEKMSETHETLGVMKLYIDGKVVTEKPFRTQSGHYAICGEGLCIGYDSGDAVSREYNSKFSFTGGTILKVIYDVSDDAYVNVAHEFKTKMATQ